VSALLPLLATGGFVCGGIDVSEAEATQADPFAGSGVTTAVAEQLGWHWIITERSLTYLQGAALRFHGQSSLKTYFAVQDGTRYYEDSRILMLMNRQFWLTR
jgi:hypothetical protein